MVIISGGIIMKRYFFLLSIIALFVSCKLNPDTEVINKSITVVTFKYSRYEKTTETLVPGQTTTSEYFFTELYDLQPDKRVSQTRHRSDDDNTITISDIQGIELYVNNTFSFPVSLSADGWMDEMANIQPGDTNDDNHKGKIYTDKPTFTVHTDGSIATAQYQIKNGVMYATIR
jgi:hypothetical protein